MAHLARPTSGASACAVNNPARAPSRVELLKKSKGYAGEHRDLPQENAFSVHRNTIHYSGHMPGLHNSIGTGYPNLVKKSAMFLEVKGQPGWGGPRAPTSDATHDKWGSIKPLPDQLKRDVANMYLQAAHPSEPIDTSIGVGYSPDRRRVGAQPSEVAQKYFPHTINHDGVGGNDALSFSPQRTGSATGCRKSHSAMAYTPTRMGSRGTIDMSFNGNDDLSPQRRIGDVSGLPAATSPLVSSTRVPVSQPAHISGYKGFVSGTRHTYGENFNRIGSRAKEHCRLHGAGGKGVTAASTSLSPQRHFGEYEAHNLVVANRNAITH